MIVWFRNDLRLHDNEALTDALIAGDEELPVFIFDERKFFGKTKFGFRKTERFRAKFIVESVLDLKRSLQALGSDLYVRIGKPEEEVFNIAKETKSHWVFCNRERTQEEEDVQDALEHNLWTIGQEIRYSRGKMLYYTSDLPFPVTHTPDTFSQFRKEVERIVTLRDPLPTPTDKFADLSFSVEWGTVPTLEELKYEAFDVNAKGGYEWLGGEKEGLRQLHYYLWETDLVADYKETRNGLLGRDYSSKLSPWLSKGCLSPKMIYFELQKYEQERTKNKSTYGLFYELLWRDYFRLVGKKYGNEIFKLRGTNKSEPPRHDGSIQGFMQWANGNTGTPFIDANMRELNQTGFMSNRGRQNVASFLVKDLKLDWRMGAEYFESLLLDYDPCSNYGNWNYIAGVGSDPREDRYFNIISQARRYDGEGDYVRYWLPELRALPANMIHTPDQASTASLQEYDVTLGKSYPKALISSDRWVAS